MKNKKVNQIIKECDNMDDHYSKCWKESSKEYFKHHYYEWASNQLTHLHSPKILDIGCGSGRGLLTLYNAFSPHPNITCLECNSHCIDLSVNFLSSHIPTTKSCKRYKKFRLIKNRLEINNDYNPYIIQSNVLQDDEELENYLEKIAPFDLITIWFLGESGSSALKFPEMDDERTCRESVCRIMFNLSEKILSSKGFIHMVNRGIDNPDYISGNGDEMDVLYDISKFKKYSSNKSDLCEHKSDGIKLTFGNTYYIISDIYQRIN